MRQQKVKISAGEKAFRFLLYLLLTAVAALCILPFILIVRDPFPTALRS